MNTHKCRILLVDDHERMREALRQRLASYDDVEVIAEATDGEEAIIRVASLSARYDFDGHQHAEDEWHSGNRHYQEVTQGHGYHRLVPG
jgi:CheY-like chemotaxis protein